MSARAEPWIWGNIGFHTAKKLWFLELLNHKGLVNTYFASSIILRNGYGVQYQWPDRGPRPFWHVRERIFSEDVASITFDSTGNLIVAFAKPEVPDEQIPEDYTYITYAFSLKTARGFIEIYDSKDRLLKSIKNRWILVEDLTHKTVGEYPNIRLRVEREAIREILITKTAVILRGKLNSNFVGS